VRVVSHVVDVIVLVDDVVCGVTCGGLATDLDRLALSFTAVDTKIEQAGIKMWKYFFLIKHSPKLYCLLSRL
jgi:hypothetical protein